jgi:hypothetical protein
MTGINASIDRYEGIKERAFVLVEAHPLHRKAVEHPIPLIAERSCQSRLLRTG